MPRSGNGKTSRKSVLRRATTAVKRLFTRGSMLDDSAPDTAELQQTRPRKAEPHVARPAKRQTDIPFDVLDRTYTPPLTSSKTSFRSDGADHQLDQDITIGRADERWNEEDRYTNRSGDPRIGTHRRHYEPGEARE